MRTRLCDMLGIQHPIIQGGMAGITLAEMVAAVSNAGGLGTLAGGTFDGDGLTKQIRKLRDLTDKPFSVNIPVRNPRCDDLIAVVIAEDVPVVTTAAGDPMKYTRRLQEAGIKVMHVSPSVMLAQRVAQAGADIVIAEGSESGGYIGHDEVSTLALIPQVVDAVPIPVVAAGGIGDARGFVAALALGAIGVQMGTRFIATEECLVSEEYKESILKAIDTDTEVIGRGTSPSRILKSEASADSRELGAGQVAGLVRRILSAGKVIEEIVAGGKEICKELATL